MQSGSNQSTSYKSTSVKGKKTFRTSEDGWSHFSEDDFMGVKNNELKAYPSQPNLPKIILLLSLATFIASPNTQEQSLSSNTNYSLTAVFLTYYPSSSPTLHHQDQYQQFHALGIVKTGLLRYRSIEEQKRSTKLNKRLVVVQREFEILFSYIDRFFSIYFNTVEEMTTENIFLDAQKWTHYCHPTKELENLQERATPAQIRNYFIHKHVSGSMLRRLSHRQMEKVQDSIKHPKLKLILKEKARKFNLHRRSECENGASSAKSSSKTNSCSEEDQEVSQYLNFQEHQQLETINAQ